jgi:hypothetical protein
MADDLELEKLDNYTGTEHYYSVLGSKITDGVKYIMDNGYSWLVTDTIAVITSDEKLMKEDFLSIKFELGKKPETGTLSITDGNDTVFYKQNYTFTTAKRNIKMFFQNNTLCLMSEY